jgi:hypothetical protein
VPDVALPAHPNLGPVAADRGVRRAQPSTADETADDPTIRRCIGFAKRWGYGGLVMLNLFAFRATDPRDMRAAADPIGPDNDWHLTHSPAALIVAAWGAGGTFMDRDRAVRAILGDRLMALGHTNHGQPRHPLYVRGDTELTAA